MKLWGLMAFALTLGVNAASAGEAHPQATRVEQLSAQVDGRTYHVQVTRVKVPSGKAKELIVKELSVATAGEPIKTVTSVNLETPLRLNGSKFTAEILEPLKGQDRSDAVELSRQQSAWAVESAPARVAGRMQNFPAYGPLGENNFNLTYDPNLPSVQAHYENLAENAARNSDLVAEGLQREENASNQDAQNFANGLRNGAAQAFQLHEEAQQSGRNFGNSVYDFSNMASSLGDRELETLTDRILRSDPVLENIVDDSERTPSNDVRAATADVSPLNPAADKNFKIYPGRFRDNGLLQNGLFANREKFPPTALGHRILESANILSDAVSADRQLVVQPASRQLVGAAYDYVHAAMKAQSEGRFKDAERLLAKGRELARALHGYNLPDNVERAISSPELALDMHEEALRETLGLQSHGSKFLSEAFNRVQPETETGIAAKSLGQAMTQNNLGLDATAVRDLGYNLLDLTLGFVPVAGGLKSLVYIVAGKNLLTGQPLSALDYTLCAIDVLSLGEASSIAKVARGLPQLMGRLFHGSAELSAALTTGAKYVRAYPAFARDAAEGLRTLEVSAPGFVLKNFVSNPGATLALGQNISRHGGAELAKDLLEYGASKAMNVTELAHISRFAGGYSKLVSVEDFAKYASQSEFLSGRDAGRMFVTATEDLEKALTRVNSQEGLAAWIGKPIVPGAPPSEGFVRMDFKFDLKLNPELPTGGEAGANAYFQSGGFTNGGAPELVVDPIQMNRVELRGKVEL